MVRNRSKPFDCTNAVVFIIPPVKAMTRKQILRNNRLQFPFLVFSFHYAKVSFFCSREKIQRNGPWRRKDWQKQLKMNVERYYLQSLTQYLIVWFHLFVLLFLNRYLRDTVVATNTKGSKTSQRWRRRHPHTCQKRTKRGSRRSCSRIFPWKKMLETCLIRWDNIETNVDGCDTSTGLHNLFHPTIRDESTWRTWRCFPVR